MQIALIWAAGGGKGAEIKNQSGEEEKKGYDLFNFKYRSFNFTILTPNHWY